MSAVTCPECFRLVRYVKTATPARLNLTVERHAGGDYTLIRRRGSPVTLALRKPGKGDYRKHICGK